MEQLFIFFSICLLVTGLMVITSVNPIHSVFWLTLTFLLSACLFITLQMDFIALMLIIVYVGAIAILFLFVILLLDVFTLPLSGQLSQLLPTTLIIGLTFFFNLWWLNHHQLHPLSHALITTEWEFTLTTNIQTLAQLLYTDLAWPFLLVSLILLVAMIAALLLTHELGKETKRQNLSHQHHRNNSWT